MINNFEKFSIREIFGIFIPGIYLTSILGKLINPILNVSDNEIQSLDYFLLFIVSTLIGLIIYSIDFPKKIFFFKKSTPTFLISKKIKTENLSISKVDIKNAYFLHYDNEISFNQKVLTEKLTTLFHFSANIFLCSIFLLIVEFIYKFFNCDYTNTEVYFLNKIVLVLSLISGFGLFYSEGKINDIFQRQFNSFISSNRYKDLIN